MSRRIRVVLEPELEDVLGVRTVLQAKLTLQNRGTGTSLAPLKEGKAAELVFHAAYLDQGRKPERKFEKFATLAGKVSLVESTGAPRFLCEPEQDFTYENPPPSGEKPFRKLSLAYDGDTFVDAPEGKALAAKLRLPDEPEGARFLEIGVDLKIAGDDEGTFADNDVCDVPLGPIEALSTTLPLDQLRGLAQIMSPNHFAGWMMFVFGHDIPDRAYRSLHRSLLSEAMSMPPIEIVASLPEDNVAGYDQDEGKIKVARSFVKNAEKEPEDAALLMAALIEEFGHFIDDDLRTRLSKTGGDAELDEGALFGYSIVNLGWDLKDEETFATYLRDAEQVPLNVQWPVFKASLDRVLGPEEQRADDMAGAIEFFGAGRGHDHGKPGVSFGHESIEDALGDSFDKEQRREIYFGNWLRDFSQAITPTTLGLFKWAGRELDRRLPGTRPGPTRFESDPRGVITDMLDLIARAKFDDLPKFRVNQARLGVYRSWEHLDNPDGLTDSSLDAELDKKPTPQQLAIDPTTQMAAYLRGRLTRPALSAAEYMRGEISAALAEGPTTEGRRRLGQGLHTLEDFFSHTNFCELFLRKFGKTTVVPWVPMVNVGGKQFLPLVSGIFGADDTAASIFLAIAEILEADKDKKCEAQLRGPAVRIAIMVVRDLRPHIGKQIDAALSDVEGFKAEHPIIFNLMCNTLGVVMRFLHFLCGVIGRACANQIDEAQVLINGKDTTSPTHTQLAKDHDDHPFHALAARCAKIAVKDVGQMVSAVWTSMPGARSEAEILDGAERYFVHPDKMNATPTPGLLAITKEVEDFAKNPANAGAISQASTKTPTVDHLKEMKKQLDEVTGSIPLERLRQTFGF